ncbi:MAG: hypothetical protein AAB875_00800 [Patescibacteria group bacterium]
MKKVNLIGQKFEKLLVIKETGVNKWGNCLFLCKCDCGNQKIIPSANLRDNRTKSCGCMSSRNKIGLLNFSHGFCSGGHQSFYNRFMTIKARCNNPKSHKYYLYGKRGIECLWKSFEEFRNDMYKSYLKHIKKFGNSNTLIDRINVNGHYSKNNCRWVTAKESANNTRQNIHSIK